MVEEANVILCNKKREEKAGADMERGEGRGAAMKRGKHESMCEDEDGGGDR